MQKQDDNTTPDINNISKPEYRALLATAKHQWRQHIWKKYGQTKRTYKYTTLTKSW